MMVNSDWSSVIRGVPVEQLMEVLKGVKPGDWVVPTSMSRMHVVRVAGAAQPETVGTIIMTPNACHIEWAPGMGT